MECCIKYRLRQTLTCLPKTQINILELDRTFLWSDQHLISGLLELYNWILIRKLWTKDEVLLVQIFRPLD